MSLINREDTINYLMTNMNWHDEDGYTVEDAEEKRAIITDLINGVPDADDGWISVKDRLPEEDHWLGGSGKQFSDNVLVSIINRDDEDEWVDISQTIDGNWTLELPRDYCNIIAWKPLPKPCQPKEDGERDE